MQVKTSPVFQLFEQQHQEAKGLFLDLGKQIKAKKAIELLSKIEFLELYADLMSKIHSVESGNEKENRSPFSSLKKSLRKIHHLKLVERIIKRKSLESDQTFESFKSYLDLEKRKIQKEAFDLAVGSSLRSWEDFLDRSKSASKGLKPLMISTAIHQLINEELNFLNQDMKSPLSTSAFRDLFESLRKIIMLENFLIHLGFNPIFVSQIHGEIQSLKENLKPWYANHLSFQALTHFLSEKESPSKKYIEWLKELKQEKKSLSSEIEKQAFELMNKVLV
jgi:hypothetical protein